jgi:hypothetical protein
MVNDTRVVVMAYYLLAYYCTTVDFYACASTPRGPESVEQETRKGVGRNDSPVSGSGVGHRAWMLDWRAWTGRNSVRVKVISRGVRPVDFISHRLTVFTHRPGRSEGFVGS